MNSKIVTICAASMLLIGCANDKPLGQSVAKLRAEQTYDPAATLKNKDVIPTGTGARMQIAYDDYTGQSAYSGRAESVLGKDLISQDTTGGSSSK